MRRPELRTDDREAVEETAPEAEAEEAAMAPEDEEAAAAVAGVDEEQLPPQ